MDVVKDFFGKKYSLARVYSSDELPIYISVINCNSIVEASKENDMFLLKEYIRDE